MLYQGEIGTVQTWDGQTASILLQHEDACDTCGLKVICAPGNHSKRLLKLPHNGNLEVGQEVTLQEGSDLELHLALAQFGVPMLAFLLGLFLGYLLPFQDILRPELWAFVGSCLGLFLSFFVARQQVRNIVARIPEKYLRIIPRG